VPVVLTTGGSSLSNGAVIRKTQPAFGSSDVARALYSYTVFDAICVGASQEDADTSAASGTVSVTGVVASTDGSDTLATSGAVSITGNAASTDAADTAAASGAVASHAVGASTETADTSAATGANLTHCVGASPESGDTASGTAAVAVTGIAASADASDLGAAAGSIAIAGNASSTEASDASAASGSVAAAGVTGAIVSLEVADASVASGTVVISGVAALSGDAAFAALIGAVRVGGAIASNDNDDLASGEGGGVSRQYGLGGMIQTRPITSAQTYVALGAQPYPAPDLPALPLAGVDQPYPLRRAA
jgi:hypothetical protein